MPHWKQAGFVWSAGFSETKNTCMRIGSRQHIQPSRAKSILPYGATCAPSKCANKPSQCDSLTGSPCRHTALSRTHRRPIAGDGLKRRVRSISRTCETSCNISLLGQFGNIAVACSSGEISSANKYRKVLLRMLPVAWLFYHCCGQVFVILAVRATEQETCDWILDLLPTISQSMCAPGTRSVAN